MNRLFVPNWVFERIRKFGHTTATITSNVNAKADSFTEIFRAPVNLTRVRMLEAIWDQYEELRKETDGGSESMTHEDAIAQIKYWRRRDELLALEQKPPPKTVTVNAQVQGGYMDFDQIDISVDGRDLTVEFLMDGQSLITRTEQINPRDVFSFKGIVGFIKYSLM